MQIKVYVTSKREHASKIIAAIPDGFHCNARWLFMDHLGDRPVTHWLRENFDDAIAANFVVLYVEPGDSLKTSLIEIGHALAYGKQVRIAGIFSEKDIELEYKPHKYLDPWIGLTDQIKLTGSLAQTFKAIRKEVEQRYEILNSGLTQQQKDHVERIQRSETRT